MTVLDSVIGRVKPGRMEDHLAMGLEVSKLMERLGAQHPRLAMATATGEPAGTFVFSTEHENGEAWGEFSDHITTDLEFQAFMQRVSDPNAPSTIESFSLSYEIELRQNNPTRGNVIEIHVSHPVPGRLEQGLEEATRVLELIESRGATNARLFQLGFAGPGSGLMMVSWEFENMKALGRVSDRWRTDPEMIEIASSQFRADPTTSPVFDGVYQVVPL